VRNDACRLQRREQHALRNTDAANHIFSNSGADVHTLAACDGDDHSDTRANHLRVDHVRCAAHVLYLAGRQRLE
jgi:hypothetical protein